MVVVLKKAYVFLLFILPTPGLPPRRDRLSLRVGRGDLALRFLLAETSPPPCSQGGGMGGG